MTNPTAAQFPRRTLIVLTSHDRLGATGKQTGAYLSEITHVYWTLVRAGIEVDFVSPRGGQVPLDGIDRSDADNARLLDDGDAMARLHASLRPDQVEPSRYAAIYYAGGHGTMWDLPGDAGLARLAAAIYDAGGIVAAVCHGPAGLVNIKLATGQFLIAGKDVAAFTDAEERAMGLTEVVPFPLARALVERGAHHVAAPNFVAQVVVSERLITGQNPASARGVGEALVAALARPDRKSSLLRGALSSALLATLVACTATGTEPTTDLGGGKGDLASDRIVLIGFEQPESVEWDDEARVWYVSNFGGAPQLDGIDRDGDGFISRVSATGQQVEHNWIVGLDAPKGMRLVGRTLYVVDVNQVLAIDVETQAIVRRYPVEGSIFLNDLDVAADGSLYVTDTIANTIVQIDHAGEISTLASGDQLGGPNGIRIDGDRLVVAGWGPIIDPMTFATSRPGDLYAISLVDRAQTVIATAVGNLDGLERTETGFLVTSWQGTVLDIDRDGTVTPREDGFHSGADVSRGHGRLAVPELLDGRLTVIAE